MDSCTRFRVSCSYQRGPRTLLGSASFRYAKTLQSGPGSKVGLRAFSVYKYNLRTGPGGANSVLFMGVVLVIFLGITVLWALITSLNAVIITARNCISLGSTEDFFSDIWKGSGGNLLTIVGVLILCVPLWLFLVIKIRLKKRHVSYRAETRYASKLH